MANPKFDPQVYAVVERLGVPPHFFWPSTNLPRFAENQPLVNYTKSAAGHIKARAHLPRHNNDNFIGLHMGQDALAPHGITAVTTDTLRFHAFFNFIDPKAQQHILDHIWVPSISLQWHCLPARTFQMVTASMVHSEGHARCADTLGYLQLWLHTGCHYMSPTGAGHVPGSFWVAPNGCLMTWTRQRLVAKISWGGYR